MAARKGTGSTPVEAITHDDKRVNIPTADAQAFVDQATRAPVQLRDPRDPTLDPQLVWKGKDDQDGDDLVVEAPPSTSRRRSTRGYSSRTCGVRPPGRRTSRSSGCSTPSTASKACSPSSSTSTPPTGRAG